MKKQSQKAFTTPVKIDGEQVGWIDRSREHPIDDTEIFAELECGYKQRFWVHGKPDEWYINQLRKMKGKGIESV